jgi:hypothetical protein
MTVGKGKNRVLALRRLVFHRPGIPASDCAWPGPSQAWHRARDYQDQAASRGLPAVLTAPARAALQQAGRGEETAIQPNKETVFFQQDEPSFAAGQRHAPTP